MRDRRFIAAAVLCLWPLAAGAETLSPPAGAGASDTVAAGAAGPFSDQTATQQQLAGDDSAATGAAGNGAPRSDAAPADKTQTAAMPDLSSPVPQSGIYRLGEVVVIGNPNIDAPGQSINQVDQQTIQDKDARTLDEALQQLPGVDIRLRKEGVPRLDIRGLPPRHVPLFLNGVPINAASDGQFDPSLIPTENIAQINVIRGTSSVLYGPGALGGVVNIVTKKGQSPPSADASTEFGAGNERLERASISGREGNFDAFASGSYFTEDDYPVADSAPRDNSDKKRGNFFFNGGYTPNDQWSFGINFGYLSGQQGIPPSTINDKNNIFASTPKFERLDDLQGRSGQVDVRYAPTHMMDFRLTGYFNKFDTEDNIYDNANYDSMSNPKVKTQHLQNNDFVTGGQLQSNFDFGPAGVVTLGLIAKSENSTSEGQIRDVPAGGGNFNFRGVDTDDTIDTYTTALQYSVAPLPRTRVVMGVAGDWFTQPDHATRTEPQAMASASYRLLDDVRLNAAVSQDVRFPSTQELFDPTQGNPNLDPERAFNVQGGFDWTLPDKSHVDVTGFRNKVSGFIQNDKASNTFQNNNVLLRGVEVEYRAVVLESLAFRAAYSFLDTTVEQPTPPDTTLDLRPEHKLDFQGIYSFADDWKAYLATTYLAHQTISSRTTPVVQETLNNYAIVDVKVSRSFLHDHLMLYVGANNLFDQQSDIGPGFPLEGRFIFGGLATHI